MFSHIIMKLNVFLIRAVGFIARHTIVRFTSQKPTVTLTIPLSSGASIQCAVYYPGNNKSVTTADYPVYVSLHGGGFVAGHCADDSQFCHWLSNEVKCIVVSPDYRLAPEYPYPQGLNDCVETVRWIRKKFQSDRVAIGGFSAGGTLAFGTAQVLQKSGEGIDSVNGFYCPMDFSSRSQHTMPEKDPMIRCVFHQAYLLNTDPNTLEDPVLSPVYAPSDSLPDSVIMIAAEDDPNHIDIQNFIDRMNIEKPTTFIGKVFKGVFHGWTLVPEFIIGKEGTAAKWTAYRMVADELVRVFNRKLSNAEQ